MCNNPAEVQSHNTEKFQQTLKGKVLKNDLLTENVLDIHVYKLSAASEHKKIVKLELN